MPKPSRLGKVFSELGALGWDECFPREICGKCELAAMKCGADEYCTAILAIGAAGLLAAGSQESAQRFVSYIRVASTITDCARLIF
jgi:hypothetical protein